MRGLLQTELKRQRVCRHVILATNDKALRSAGSQMTTIHTVPMHVRSLHTLLLWLSRRMPASYSMLFAAYRVKIVLSLLRRARFCNRGLTT